MNFQAIQFQFFMNKIDENIFSDEIMGFGNWKPRLFADLILF